MNRIDTVFNSSQTVQFIREYLLENNAEFDIEMLADGLVYLLMLNWDDEDDPTLREIMIYDAEPEWLDGNAMASGDDCIATSEIAYHLNSLPAPETEYDIDAERYDAYEDEWKDHYCQR